MNCSKTLCERSVKKSKKQSSNNSPTEWTLLKIGKGTLCLENGCESNKAERFGYLDNSDNGWDISSAVKETSYLHYVVNDNIKHGIVVDIDPIIRILSILL